MLLVSVHKRNTLELKKEGRIYSQNIRHQFKRNKFSIMKIIAYMFYFSHLPKVDMVTNLMVVNVGRAGEGLVGMFFTVSFPSFPCSFA
jgi:hypothetical protein